MKTVAVIGAGAAGIVATKCCIDEGLQPTCFERTNDLGGLWNYSKEVVEGHASVMKSTITNTSKEMMCFSDFPYSKEVPMFMSHTEVLRYFRSYVDKFNLKKHINLNHEIIKVEQTSNFKTSGQWNVVVKDKLTGHIKESTFDAIMICCGHFTNKYIPDLSGLDSFTGKVLHSHDYRDYHGYEDKRVIVVGLGNSGGDIAVELGLFTSQLYVSTRTGRWIFGRISEGGTPLDMNNLSRCLQFFRNIFPKSVIQQFFKLKLNKILNHNLYSLTPALGPLSSGVLVNDELPLRMATGKCILKSDIKSVKGKSVTFTDGTVLTDIDALIFATGYDLTLPDFIRKDVKGIGEAGKETLFYKLMVPPDLEKHTLAFIGYLNGQGPVFPILELQARYVTRMFKGDITLPPKENMWADIHGNRRDRKTNFRDTKGHFINVDLVKYHDVLSTAIGCRPHFGKLFLKDPKLALKCFFGPLTPYQHRLQGPCKWAGARDAILTAWERTLFPLKTRPMSYEEGHFKTILGVIIFVTLLLNIGWLLPVIW